MIEKSDKLIILDLDETLVHSTEYKLPFEEDFRFENYFVYKRDYLDWFLTSLSEHFRIGIWSSGDDAYVAEVAKIIKPANIDFELVWGRSKCTIKRDHKLDCYYFEKKLDKLKKKGFNLDKVIIVDDSPEKSKSNYGNAIYISEFLGNKPDVELRYLYDYLLTLKDVQNIRKIEKRGWREKSRSLDGFIL
jgi:carboxy-terminal domain RNA polymerase II polypeptide A small phosphatase